VDGEESVTWCPSGSAHKPESVVLGVRAEPDRLTYLAAPLPARDALGMVPDDISPTRVLRFASHCVAECANRRGNDCTLVERVATLPADAESPGLPRCHLRPHCQWWQQSGPEACRRCPHVVTTVLAEDGLMNLVSDPLATPAQVARAVGAAGADSGSTGDAAH
jgi:hypothetical protein